MTDEISKFIELASITLGFKPDAQQSDMEKVLAQYTHEKVFGEDYMEYLGNDPLLDKLYVLQVTKNAADDIVTKLKENYGDIIDAVYVSPERK